MLFLVWGASGSGKTTCMKPLSRRFPDLAVHDFDEAGVPLAPDARWRHRAAERWVKRALAHQAKGQDMLLCGQVTYGEMLACPSAGDLEGIVGCLLDCHDYERVERIRRRERGTEAATQDMLCWAAWLRMHALDPRWRTDVITGDSAPEMRWDRWQHWDRNDPRWRVHIVDTTGNDVKASVDRLVAWIVQEQDDERLDECPRRPS